jgi:FMN phosphatase YigB (HAD superfamily)
MTKNPPTVPLSTAALQAAISAVNPDAVVFDLFDTLLVRDVHPEDVKRIACGRAARVLGNISGRDLYAQRARIELELCNANAAQGYDFEFHFDAMAARLAEAAVPGGGIERSWLVSLLRESELAVESSVQHVDPEMLALLKALTAQGKPLYLLSDFYLPAETLSRLLDAHGILSYFSMLFVSCDALRTKRSGNGYRRLLEETGSNAGSLLMIGDNPESDFRQARANGLNALLVDRTAEEGRYRRSAARFKDSAEISSKVRDLVSSRRSENEGTVFPELSLSLYFFIQNIHTRLVAKRARDVFFLSREGQLLKRLFDYYQRHACFDGALFIKSHYLESSRRASFMPSLGPIETEMFETLFRQYRRMSLADFVMNLGLDDHVERFRTLIGPAFDDRVDDLRTRDDFTRMLQGHDFRDLYSQRNSEQFQSFMQYLKGFERHGAERTLHIVDVGWKGTIQDNIFRIINRNLRDSPFDEIEGYYMGLLECGSANERNRKHGLLFNTVTNHVSGYPAFNENRSLFEVLLAADHGSAKCYRVLDDNTAIVERQASDEENRLFHGKIAIVQHDIELRFEKLCDVFLTHRWTNSELLDMTVRAHARMVFSPTREEVEWFRSAYHLENFGVFERTNFRGDEDRQSFTARAQATLRILKAGLPRDLGVWPWLTLHQQTLAPLPLAYKLFRHGQLRKRRKKLAAVFS